MPILVPATSVVALDDVKEALNKTLSVDDAELERMILAALAEYAEYVAPLPGTVTETHDGGSASLVLRSRWASSLTSAAYADGSNLAVSDLDLDTASGIVYWRSGTTGYFTCGTRNVTITYTVGELPTNHIQTIVADVAGYFEASQRADSTAAFPGEGFDEAPYRTSPMVLFPRIRALAPPQVG